MGIYKLITILAGFLFLTACSTEQRFISDDSVRKQVNEDFEAKKQAMPYGDFFRIVDDNSILPLEKEALTFLYAYMPIGDVTDYTPEFYLENVRTAFKARQEMTWGKTVPEELFRHFVLPVRVNNENMDESRMVFYPELKERIKGMSMYDAVLEINHWCHEKVTYTPSDSRTSSPLATIKTAYGRCGEESVFTVAALRSVGIPARQVYTPRWAHTDNNHAWVEAWVDGKWYFLGACEPEPVLNMAWFNEPASRGMLMHTRAFGKYNGAEEIMEETDCFTEINVTANYAPTAKVEVTVTDSDNNPVSGATVEFKLYNYAEFYTVASKLTNADGKASLTAGKGDMLIWVTHNGLFGFQKASFGQDNAITIVLNHKPGDNIVSDLDIVPPVSNPIPATATEEQKEENSRRLAEEDEIRNNYVAGFYTEEKAGQLAAELGTDPKQTIKYMVDSRGNWEIIENFLRKAAANGDKDKAMNLLGVISAKDLRDITEEVLNDNLSNGTSNKEEIFVSYVLNPRVGNELLTPYHSYFKEIFTDKRVIEFQTNPQMLVEWTKNFIQIKDNLNPQKIPVSPIGVHKSRVADTHSRNIFFVALARSLEIPARIEPVTGKIQYYSRYQWNDVAFESSTPVTTAKGDVILSYDSKQSSKAPQYYNHFTIANMLPNAQLHTLNFRSTAVDMGTGSIWDNAAKKKLELDEGNYLLVTGTRMAKGNVLARIHSFTVSKDKPTEQTIVIRENTDDVQVIGSMDAEEKFNLAQNGKETSILATTGRGYFIIGILGSQQEPTNHALRDIAAVSQEFEKWNRSMILLFLNQNAWEKYKSDEFGKLPSTVTYGIDTDSKISKMIAKEMNLNSAENLPIFVIADSFGRIVFVSQGYTIGLGEQMMNVINKL